MTALPPPNQTWVHAVDNKRMLLEALHNDSITAIETDVLMGHTEGTTTTTTDKIPIMAHPPNTQSDLPMTEFVHLIYSHQSNNDNNNNSPSSHGNIRKTGDLLLLDPQPQGLHDMPSITSSSNRVTNNKIVKLDFKEMAAVEPTLKAFVDASNVAPSTDTTASVIFLNADILPGPGHRDPNDLQMNATEFIETCLPYMEEYRQDTTTTARRQMAFSLGFKTDCSDLGDGYTMDDFTAMANLISQYRLVERRMGIVLALNARQLAKSLFSVDNIMLQFPHLQILAWTGKGEPPIPEASIEQIRHHFESLQMTHRIGYDCQVSS